MKDGETDANETMCPVTKLAGPRLWNSHHSQGLSVKHRQQHLIKIKLDTKGELEKHKIQLSRFKIQYKKGDIPDRKTEKVLWGGETPDRGRSENSRMEGQEQNMYKNVIMKLITLYANVKTSFKSYFLKKYIGKRKPLEAK